MIVRIVNINASILAGSDPQIGDGEITDPEEELSKQNFNLPNGYTSADVWED